MIGAEDCALQHLCSTCLLMAAQEYACVAGVVGNGLPGLAARAAHHCRFSSCTPSTQTALITVCLRGAKAACADPTRRMSFKQIALMGAHMLSAAFQADRAFQADHAVLFDDSPYS